MPSFGRNLISVLVLDKSGYHCSFGDRKFGLYKDPVLIGTGNLGTYDNLYLVDTKASMEHSDAGPGAKPISHRDTRDELGMGLPWGVLI